MSHCVRPNHLTCSICGEKVQRSEFKAVHLPACRTARDLRKGDRQAGAQPHKAATSPSPSSKGNASAIAQAVTPK